MSQTLLIAPPPANRTSHSGTTLSAPSAPGLPDTLRVRNTKPLQASESSTPSSTSLQSVHPLEARLRNWERTQTALRATLMRRQFGVAAPVMRAMELQDCMHGEAPALLGGMRSGGRGGVHGDILRGEDWEIGGWEGVYGGDAFAAGDSGYGVGGDFHWEMEGQLGMRW